MLIKHFLGEEKINIISAYTPPIGLEESIKKTFGRNVDNQLCFKRVTKEVLGYHKECGQPTKETWCWTEEVQTTLRSKRENHKSQHKCRDDECHSFKL